MVTANECAFSILIIVALTLVSTNLIKANTLSILKYHTHFTVKITFQKQAIKHL